MNVSISLRAILAGTIIALAMQALFNLLGLGLDLISFRINNQVMNNMTLTTGVWLIITSSISLFVGGIVAGRAANSHSNAVAVLHGIVTWGLATLIVFILATPTAEILIGGAAMLIAQAFSASGQATISGGMLHVEPEAAQMILRSGQILGSAAIIIFAAFVFSAITAVVGAICGTKCLK